MTQKQKRGKKYNPQDMTLKNYRRIREKIARLEKRIEKLEEEAHIMKLSAIAGNARGRLK